MIVSLFGVVRVRAFIYQSCHSERSEEIMLRDQYSPHGSITPASYQGFLVAKNAPRNDSHLRVSDNTQQGDYWRYNS